MKTNYFIILVSGLLISSCANTEIIQDWVEEELGKTYQHPRIIGISNPPSRPARYMKNIRLGAGKV